MINSLPNNKVLNLYELTAFADDNLNMYQKLKFALGSVENIVGKEENAGCTMFSKGFFRRVVKSRDCVIKSKEISNVLHVKLVD